MVGRFANYSLSRGFNAWRDQWIDYRHKLEQLKAIASKVRASARGKGGDGFSPSRSPSPSPTPTACHSLTHTRGDLVPSRARSIRASRSWLTPSCREASRRGMTTATSVGRRWGAWRACCTI